jgi:hypothetical protein
VANWNRSDAMDAAESFSGGGNGVSSSASSFFFPPVAQPEVMRAAEKDEHYVASLCDACHEAFRHAMGKWMLHFCLVVELRVDLDRIVVAILKAIHSSDARKSSLRFCGGKQSYCVSNR